METTAAFTGLECTDCGATHGAETLGRCPDCGGTLAPAHDADAVAADPAAIDERSPGLWRFRELLPLTPADAVSVGEGGTPLVSCPSLADELGVGEVLVKDEGRNPTGALADRGASLAVSAAAAAGAEGVALPSTGTTGQAVATYAGRAGLDATVYVPSRAGFVRKAMVNVHGGEMSVVEGRFGDAVAAYEERAADADWAPARPFDSPYYLSGLETVLYEVASARDWTAPDAVIHPTGTGAGVVASHRAATRLRANGLVDETPALYAAQADGCAPVAQAFQRGGSVEPVEHPDTIAGGIEVADPPGGDGAVTACRETGGRAVAVGDPDLLESAVRVTAGTGVELSVTGGVAAAAAWELAESGAFDGDETVVLVNDDAGSKDADVLRSHLMGQGV
jgi:threonine synthase